MPLERDQYVRVKVKCQACFSLIYCRILARRETATLMFPCPQCKQDVVTIVIPDEKMDGQKSEKGLWMIPVYDLICLQSGLTEEEGDRLLWGMGDVLETRIKAFLESEQA